MNSKIFYISRFRTRTTTYYSAFSLLPSMVGNKLCYVACSISHRNKVSASFINLTFILARQTPSFSFSNFLIPVHIMNSIVCLIHARNMTELVKPKSHACVLSYTLARLECVG